jgi:hypothetical protein
MFSCGSLFFDVLRVLSTHHPQIEHGEGAAATEIKWISPLDQFALYSLRLRGEIAPVSQMSIVLGRESVHVRDRPPPS